MSIQYKTSEEEIRVPDHQEVDYMDKMDHEGMNEIVKRLISHGQQHPEEDINPEEFIGLVNRMRDIAIAEIKADLLKQIEISVELIDHKVQDSEERVFSFQRMKVILSRHFKEEIEDDATVKALYERIKREVI